MVERREERPTLSGSFPQTRWSVVIRSRGTTPEAGRALDELCRLYWPPVYGFLRRKGNSPADAEDLTQGFFASLLARGSLEGVAEEKGRLRTFLLKAATRHMLDQRDRAMAARRGGRDVIMPLEFAKEEEFQKAGDGNGASPEIEFERRWALRLLDHVMEQLKSEAVRSGRSELFEDLRGVISTSAETLPYAGLAARHGLSEGAIKATAHRLRRRFAEELRRAISDTVGEEGDVDDELRHLLSVFQNRG